MQCSALTDEWDADVQTAFKGVWNFFDSFDLSTHTHVALTGTDTEKWQVVKAVEGHN